MKFRLLLVAVALFIGNVCSYGQLLQWNTFGNAGTETTEPSVANDVGVTAASLTLGSLTTGANGNRFGGSTWGTSNPSLLSEAIAGNDYIQFVVTPNSGYTFTPTSFVFRWDRSGTGPSSVTLRSSADGYMADLGTVTGMVSGGVATTTVRTITISGLTNIATATTFRLYGYGATAAGGTGGFDQPSPGTSPGFVNVILNGTTSSSSPTVVTLADNSTQITAANVPQGTTNHILSSFQTTVANSAASLTTAAFATSGTYVAADIVTNGFTLWRNSTANNFATATAIGTLSSTSTGSGDILIFSLSPTVSLPVGTSYFWVTANIAAAAIAGNTIRVDAIANADLTFASGTKSGSASVAGFQTITLTPPAVPGNLTRGCTTNTTQVLNWTAPATGSYDGYLLVVREGGVPNAVTSIYVPTQTTNLDYALAPTYNATTSRVLYKTTAAANVSVTVTGLTAGLSYTFAVYAYKNNGASTLYSTTATTTSPTINLPNVTSASATAGNASASLTWANPNAACYDQVLVVVTAAPGITFVPTGSTNTAYTPNSVFAGFNQAVYYSSGNLVNITGLTNGTTYYLEVFVRNGSEWSSGVEVSVTPVNINPTVLKTGDLVLIAYDNTFIGANDAIRLLTMVNINPGTKFLWVNATYETGGFPASNVRTDKWFTCINTTLPPPDGNVPYLEFTYNGSSIITAGSVFCIETVSSGTTSTITAVTNSGTVIPNTSFSIICKSADGSTGLSHGIVNVSSGDPDSMFLLQGSFVYDVTGSTFVGTVLSGVQDGGLWYDLSDDLTAISGNNLRRSRKHPQLLCASLQLNTTPAPYEVSYDLFPNTGTKQFLLFEILNYATNWTATYGVCPSPSPFSISGSDSFNRWTGALSTNWFDCNNWAQLAVPDEFTDVRLITTAANDAVIDYTAPFSDFFSDIAQTRNLTISVRKVQVEGNVNNKLEVHGDLLINSTGVLDMDDSNNSTADGNLYLYKNFTNSLATANFLEGNGTVSFVGSLPQIINNNVHTNPEVFFNVILDNDFATAISNNLIATGDLEVKTNKFVTIGSVAFPNDYIRVNNRLTNNGAVIIETGGQLIQVNDTDTNNGDYSGTKFTVKRDYIARDIDYVYWGAPTKLFAVSNLPNGFHYVWNPVFPNSNGTFGNWIAPPTAQMQIGKGYIARTFNGSATPITLTFDFFGQPNNGLITSVNVSRGSYFGDGITTGLPYDAEPTNPNNVNTTRWDDNWNLVGNPYPSPLNAKAFLDANTNLEGFVNIWTHDTEPTILTDPFYADFGYNYDATDYITHNGTATISGPGGFNGNIASGQGFFVLMEDGAALTQPIVFNNAMRSDLLNNLVYDNSDFFRNAATTQNTQAEEKHRIWLDIVAPQGQVSRAVVGYVTDATNNKDRLYDAVTNANGLKLYSFTEDHELQEYCIQGRALPFVNTDTVRLGFNTTTVGSHTIAIATIDGLFLNDQTIYLEDKFLNIIHNIKVLPYTFTTDKGRFDNRFVLRYTDSAALGIDDFDTISHSVVVASNNGQLTIKSYLQSLEEVVIYDVLGRQLFAQKGIGANDFIASNIAMSQQSVIVKIKLESGIIVTKKVLL